MTQYMDKSTLVAEIERRKNICKKLLEVVLDQENKDYYQGKAEAYKEVLDLLNTLEVKDWDNVWHDASETPKGVGDKEILVQFADSHTSVLEIDDWEYLDHQTKWAYLKDLI